MKTPRRLLTQGRPPGIPVPDDSVCSPIWSGGGRKGSLGISGDSKRSIPVGAVWGTVITNSATGSRGTTGHFLDNNKERDMNDILERDYDMGIPFDVDAAMERAWARMDESDDEGGEDEE